MKSTSLAIIAILCFMAFQSNAQSTSILKAQALNYSFAKADPALNQQLFAHARVPGRDDKPGASAQRSGVSLVILGPIKMVVGVVGVSIAVADIKNNNESGVLALVLGCVGGFHLLSGIGVTAGGAVLLKKAKRQRDGRVYLNLPGVKTYTATGSSTPALGLGTTLTF